MFPFSNNNVAIANADDVPFITALLNSAYRGKSSTHGWTTEAHLIAGNVRTDEKNLLEVMQRDKSEVLKYTNAQNQIIGCVNLQQHGKKIYLGMLSVAPKLQGAGIGKHLLKAAEEYGLNLKCTSIYMTVISVRTDLIAWYERHGYRDTGERKTFEEDGLTGKHLQPLEFMFLEKQLAG
jgi:ribosomal protein S18 acetylase RimI-like enzyme